MTSRSVDASGTSTYTYDNNDNLVSESVVADGITLATGYAYNGNDQLSSTTYPYSGQVVSYSPDVLGRPTAVSGYATAVTYWPSGQVKQINYSNGTISSYAQNTRLWPSNFITKLGTTNYLSSSYTYDGAGNLTAVADTADTSYNRTLAYDNLNRLTSATGPWGTGTIAYNGVGNITSQVLGSSSITYTYNTQNRLASTSGSRATTFTYDAYGDIITAWGNTYAYDGVPNLTCFNCAVPQNKIEYAYDGLNQRVSVTKAGVKTFEVYGSHGNLLAEYAPSQNNTLTEYIYLGNKRIAQKKTVPPGSTTTVLNVSPNPALVDQSVTLTATVTGNSPGGTVTFMDGAAVLGTATLSSGQATLNVSFPSAGDRNLSASYGGDANNAPSTSAVVVLTVNTSLAFAPLPSTRLVAAAANDELFLLALNR